MLELFKKDIKIIFSGLSFKSMSILLFLYLIFYNIFGEYYGMDIVPILLSYILVIESFSKTEKNDSESYIMALPIKREDIVYSKYLLAYISIISITLVLLFLNKMELVGDLQISMEHIYISSASFLLSMTIILPSIFKFGYKRVKYVGPVITAFIYYLLNSDRTIINLAQYNKETLFIKFSRSIGRLIYRIQKNMTYDYVENAAQLYFILILIIVFILFLASMGISKAIYNNKDID